MPVVLVEGPAISDIDVKRQLTKAVTTACSEAYSLPEQTIVVILKENAAENVASGGQLIADRHATVAAS